MNDWNKIFCFEESPSELLFLIFRKSSKNPINEKPIVTPKTTHIYLFPKSAQRSVDITNEDNINKPPIVGVPVFFRCDLGPSSLTYCSNCIDFKKFIMKGPINIDINKAVMVPPIVLTVRYLKTSKPGSIETSIDPKYSNIYKLSLIHI